MENAIKEIEARVGRTATDAEIAESLGISDDEYMEWQGQMNVTNVVSLNEFMEQGSDVPRDTLKSDTFDTPEEVLEKSELKQMLMDSLELLTEREKQVILFYYYEELTLKEIAAVLDVSESRVSQLHTKALQKMKTKLGGYMGILTDRP